MVSAQPPSNSQVKKAGKVLRSWGQGKGTPLLAFAKAYDTLLEYRAAHRVPLTKATMGLRSMVNTEGCQVEVSQRLKRVPTIIGKLRNEPTMQLNTMQDIGGCRAVLNSIDEVRRVQKRLSKNRPPLRVYDYIAQPRSSGYRGVHVIVEYDGRQIEVQLRTRVMHEWAVIVERLGGRLHADLKGGRGPAPLLRFLGAVSQAMAIEEEGQVVDDDLMGQIDRFRGEAVPFLSGGPA
jgi:putative GTP pyrophosphokinase